MQLTDHTDLGLRLLILLAAARPDRLPTTTLAERHALSHTHVQKVVQSLRDAGFVHTRRGRHGGVELARAPGEIRVGDVVRALEPHLDLVECFRPGDSQCVLTGGCALAHTLRRGRAAMFAELNRTTVADLVQTSPAVERLTGA